MIAILAIATLSLATLPGQTLDPELLRSVEELIHTGIETRHMVGVTRDGTQTSYGMGWITAELDGRRIVVHIGSQVGTSTSLILLPDEGIVVAVMCNTEGTNPGPIGRRIAFLVESRR